MSSKYSRTSRKNVLFIPSANKHLVRPFRPSQSFPGIQPSRIDKSQQFPHPFSFVVCLYVQFSQFHEAKRPTGQILSISITKGNQTRPKRPTFCRRSRAKQQKEQLGFLLLGTIYNSTFTNHFNSKNKIIKIVSIL